MGVDTPVVENCLRTADLAPTETRDHRIKTLNETLLAFLTIVPGADNDQVGGLLVTNDHGRPVEFHCTEPVVANRAQQILYGSTLKDYLWGDRIATSLLAKLNMKTRLIVTDVVKLLGVREQLETPLVTIGSNTNANHQPAANRMTLAEFDLDLIWHENFPADARRAREVLQAVGRWIEPDEPLDRIRAAITEAQKSAA